MLRRRDLVGLVLIAALVLVLLHFVLRDRYSESLLPNNHTNCVTFNNTDQFAHKKWGEGNNPKNGNDLVNEQEIERRKDTLSSGSVKIGDFNISFGNCPLARLQFPIHNNIIRTYPPFKVFHYGPTKDSFISGKLSRGEPWEENFLQFYKAMFETYWWNNHQRDPKEGERGDPPPIAIDLGANIGTHTLYLAALGAEVHAFEPLQANMDLLECSVAANDLRPRIHLNRVAMSDRPAPPTCIQADEGNFGHAFMVPNGQCQNTAPVSCMDDYDEQASLPSLSPPPPQR